MEWDVRLTRLVRPGDTHLSISRIRSDGSGLILYAIAQAFVVFFTEVLGVSVPVAILIIVSLLIWQVLQKAVYNATAFHPKRDWANTIPRVLDVGYTVLVIGAFYALMQLFFAMLNAKVATTAEGVGLGILLILLISVVFRLPQPIDASAVSDEEFHAALCVKMIRNDVETNLAMRKGKRRSRVVPARAPSMRVRDDVEYLLEDIGREQTHLAEEEDEDDDDTLDDQSDSDE